MDPFKLRVERLNLLGKRKSKPQNNKNDNIPDDIFIKCPKCQHSNSTRFIYNNLNICDKCNYHYSMPAHFRLASIFDDAKYREMFQDIVGHNPLDFDGYDEKLDRLREKTGLKEAVVCAVGRIGQRKACVAVMDSRFLMGSMGGAVGERITSLIEYATAKKLPLIIFCASGGARMQEGIISLMQMAKTSAAIKKHLDTGLLYISVLTNPTTGGVTASFASLGDIILAEPDALIGFAGARVIEETIKQKLPKGFQRSEYLLECGFLDAIVDRKHMKQELSRLLLLHGVK